MWTRGTPVWPGGDSGGQGTSRQLWVQLAVGGGGSPEGGTERGRDKGGRARGRQSGHGRKHSVSTQVPAGHRQRSVCPAGARAQAVPLWPSDEWHHASPGLSPQGDPPLSPTGLPALVKFNLPPELPPQSSPPCASHAVLVHKPQEPLPDPPRLPPTPGLPGGKQGRGGAGEPAPEAPPHPL